MQLCILIRILGKPATNSNGDAFNCSGQTNEDGYPTDRDFCCLAVRIRSWFWKVHPRPLTNVKLDQNGVGRQCDEPLRQPDSTFVHQVDETARQFSPPPKVASKTPFVCPSQSQFGDETPQPLCCFVGVPLTFPPMRVQCEYLRYEIWRCLLFIRHACSQAV